MPPKSSSKKRKAEGEHDADALVAAGFDNAAFVKLAGGGIGLLTGFMSTAPTSVAAMMCLQMGTNGSGSSMRNTRATCNSRVCHFLRRLPHTQKLLHHPRLRRDRCGRRR
jgi:hypothetical protein